MNKTITTTIAATMLLALTACELPDETSTTEASETISDATEADPVSTPKPEPILTAPEAEATDEFKTWLLTKQSDVGSLGIDMGQAGEYIGDINIGAATTLSFDIAERFTALWLEAPATGTALSDSGNRWLFVCQVAYEQTGTGLQNLDFALIEEAAGLLQDCNDLTIETTGLLLEN